MTYATGYKVQLHTVYTFKYILKKKNVNTCNNLIIS